LIWDCSNTDSPLLMNRDNAIACTQPGTFSNPQFQTPASQHKSSSISFTKTLPPPSQPPNCGPFQSCKTTGFFGQTKPNDLYWSGPIFWLKVLALVWLAFSVWPVKTQAGPTTENYTQRGQSARQPEVRWTRFAICHMPLPVRWYILHANTHHRCMNPVFLRKSHTRPLHYQAFGWWVPVRPRLFVLLIHESVRTISHLHQSDMFLSEYY
jgi:hypothetical protein